MKRIHETENTNNKRKKSDLILPKDIWSEILKYVWKNSNHLQLVLVCKSFLSICNSIPFLKEVKMDYYPCLPIICKIGIDESILENTRKHIGKIIIEKKHKYYIDNESQKWIDIALNLIHVYFNSKVNPFPYIYSENKIITENLNWLLFCSNLNFFTCSSSLKMQPISFCPPHWREKILFNLIQFINLNDIKYGCGEFIPLFPELWKRYPSPKLQKFIHEGLKYPFVRENENIDDYILELLDHSFPVMLTCFSRYCGKNPVTNKKIFSLLSPENYKSPMVVNWLINIRNQEKEIYEKIKPYLNWSEIEGDGSINKFNLIEDLRLERITKKEELVQNIRSLNPDKILVHPLWDNSEELWKKLIIIYCQRYGAEKLFDKIPIPVYFTGKEINTYPILLSFAKTYPNIKVEKINGEKLSIKKKMDIIQKLMYDFREGNMEGVEFYRHMFPALHLFVLKKIKHCFCEIHAESRLKTLELFWFMLKDKNLSFPEFSLIQEYLQQINCNDCMSWVKEEYDKQPQNRKNNN